MKHGTTNRTSNTRRSKEKLYRDIVRYYEEHPSATLMQTGEVFGMTYQGIYRILKKEGAKMHSFGNRHAERAERMREFAAKAARGETIENICQDLNISYTTALKYKKELGISVQTEKALEREALKARLCLLYDKERSYARVSSITGVSSMKAWRLINDK